MRLGDAVRAGRVYLTGYVLFFPLVFFIAYATWSGQPSGERWVSAYKLASVLAAIQFLVAVMLPRPANRLVLGANLYLLIGGALAWAGADRGLMFFGRVLQESAVMLCIVAVGLLATLSTASGFVGVIHRDRMAVRSASLLVLVLAVALTAFSFVFRGNRFLAAGLPILVLTLANRWFKRRLAAMRYAP